MHLALYINNCQITSKRNDRCSLIRDAEATYLTPDEGRGLLDAVRKNSLRHYALLLVAPRTGMRQKEIIGFQWGEIDWNGKHIEILRANWKVPMVGPN